MTFRMRSPLLVSLLLLASRSSLASPTADNADQKTYDSPVSISIDWNNVLAESKTKTTLQSVAMPPLLEGSDVRQTTLESLKSVAEDYVRFVPWFPYPKLAVPELDPPVITDDECKTSWNFTYADQIVRDFLEYTPGVKHIINFSTTPGWMWKTDVPYTYPENVSEIDTSYNNGTELRDPSMKEVSDYFRRLVSWYVKGGFTDECGVYHHSGYHWDFEFWEVLNEPEFEHTFDVDYYIKLYDAVTSAIHEVAPDTKFVSLGMGTRNLTWFEHFLDTDRHEPGTPVDWMSYHFYATPDVASTPEQAKRAFEMADDFIQEVKDIEEIRMKLSPDTKTTLNEVGTFDPQAAGTATPGYVIPKEYWAWSSGIFAYVFSKVAELGIDAVGQSQLYGYPGQYESVSQVDYKTGLPNARLRTLQLLQRSFRPGDSLMKTSTTDETVLHVQAFECGGQKKLLLVNKQGTGLTAAVEGFGNGKAEIIDADTAGNEPRVAKVSNGKIQVSPYAVVVVSA